MIGSTILHYKILKKLGQGGMGVVFLAEDTKLNRKVAIKFLPKHIAVDVGDRNRFEREAQAAAALNHPNIATIYTIDESDDEMFIVMEYIDGIELKEKIKTGLIQVNETIKIAIQIAKGLDAAHKNGIVHRDIKSANIMIKDEGIVKIMDFGIAKIKGQTHHTKLGSTFGTTSYMSPEQARGSRVDHRTDIWSFGIVLYEMLSGELPFQGDYDQVVLYSIMNKQPESLRTYIPDVNDSLIKLIDKILEKDPGKRFQSMQEIINILTLIKGNKHITINPIQNPEISFFKSKKKSQSIFSKKINLLTSRSIIYITGTFIFAVILIYLLFLSRSSLPDINPNRHISAVQIPVSNFDYPAVSPDGKMLAIPGTDFNGNWDIYLMDIKSGESRKLNAETSATGISGQLYGVIFSPDGSTLSFDAINPQKRIEGIYDISVLSGYVRLIADTGIGLCWNKKKNRIYYFRGKPRAPSRSGWREYWSVAPNGSNAKLEFIDSLLHGADNSVTFSISPNSKKAVFTRPFKGDFNEIIIRNLITGVETRLTHDHKIIGDITWLTNGYILFNSDRSGNVNIWAIPSTGGKPRQITDETFNDLAMSFSTTANRLTYQQQSTKGTLWKVNTEGFDNKQVFTGLNIWYAAFSPDGSKLAIIARNQFSPFTSLMLRNLKNNKQIALLPADSYKVLAQFSPSGRFISYEEFPEGPLVSIGKIKVLNISKGNRPRDFGYGHTIRWLNDSVIVIQRVIAKKYIDFKHLGGRGKVLPSDNNKSFKYYARLLNIRTGRERAFFKNSVHLAIPVLNSTKYIYKKPHTADLYMVSKKELEKNPQATGRLIINTNKIGLVDATFSNQYFYYQTKDSIWKLDLRTFVTTKIISLTGINFHISYGVYNDNFVSYVQHQTKMNIVMIDSLFLK